MRLPKIGRPENLDDHLVDGVVRDIEHALRGMRGRSVSGVVADIVMSHDGDNDDAVDFFEAALATLSYFDEETRRKDRIDMFGNDRDADRAYNEAFDNALMAAVAFVGAKYDDALDACVDRKEEEDVIENAKICKDIMRKVGRLVTYRPGGDSRDDRRGRRDERDDRRDRNSRRDRDDRGGRSDRSSRRDRGSRRNEEDSVYSHRARNQARREDQREEREPVAERQPSRLAAAHRALIASPNCMPVVRDTVMPSLMRNSIAGVLGVQVLSNGELSHVYDKEHKLEPYAQHELRAFLNSERDGIIVPTVDFRITPELVDQQAVVNNKKVFISEEPITFSRHGWCNINVQSVMSSNMAPQAQMLVLPVVQQRDMSVTSNLLTIMESTNPTTFSDWHKFLSVCRSELQRVNAAVASGNEDYTPCDMERLVYTIGRLEDDLLFLLIQYMAIVLPAECNFTTKSFLAAWPNLASTIRDWSTDEKHEFHDCAGEFYRMEHAYLASNYRVTNTSVEQDRPVVTLTVESKSLCVYYRGAVFNLDTCLDTYGQYFQIEHKNVPELFTACSRLLRYRNSRHGLSNIYVFDSTGARVVLTGGDLDGGRCCMIRPDDEDQPFNVI